MLRSRTRHKLNSGQTAMGCFLRYPDAGLAEFLAVKGLDFIIFDGEHGTLTPPACEHLVRAVELHGVTAGIRVEANDAASILRYLDTGALVCHVPGVDSAQDAERAVRAVKYRPAGDRGLAASRASGFGVSVPYAQYVEEANRETQVVVHIESAAGVAAAHEIAAVQGVDVLLFGAVDLSHDLGVAGQLEHPDLVESAEHVAAAAQGAGKILGAVATDERGVQIWRERGAGYLLSTAEAFLTPSIDRFLHGGQA